MDKNRLREFAGIKIPLVEQAKIIKRKPRPGQKFGTSDQAPPEDFTEDQLSRLADALWAAQEAGLDPKKVFKLAPDTMKGEWNFSNWTYQKEKL